MSSRAWFMDVPVPPEWAFLLNPHGSFDLNDGDAASLNLSAIEVRNRILAYWNANGGLDEQHRAPTPAARNPALAQRPAGNPGGAPPSGGAGAGLSQQAGGPAAGLASQGAVALGGGLFSPYAGGVYGGLLQATRQALLAQQAGMWRQVTHGYLPHQEPLPRAAPVAGELIGHRAWTVQGGNLLLSVSAKSAWFPGQPMHDKIGHGQEIDDHNAAGIWAFKNPYNLAAEFWYAMQNGGVFGTVCMWGTVIEHEHGYRAQYAAIRSLDWASPGIDLEMLRAVYLPKPAKT